MPSIYNCFVLCPWDNKITLVASCIECQYHVGTSWSGEECRVECIEARVAAIIAESKNDPNGLANLVQMSKM